MGLVPLDCNPTLSTGHRQNTRKFSHWHAIRQLKRVRAVCVFTCVHGYVCVCMCVYARARVCVCVRARMCVFQTVSTVIQVTIHVKTTGKDMY